MAKKRFLPDDLRWKLVDFTSQFMPKYCGDLALVISDDHTDTKIIQKFEILGFWIRKDSIDPDSRDYESLAAEIAEYVLLEELNKGEKHVKKKDPSN